MQSGTRRKHYEIVEKIGEGCMMLSLFGEAERNISVQAIFDCRRDTRAR